MSRQSGRCHSGVPRPAWPPRRDGVGTPNPRPALLLHRLRRQRPPVLSQQTCAAVLEMLGNRARVRTDKHAAGSSSLKHGHAEAFHIAAQTADIQTRAAVHERHCGGRANRSRSGTRPDAAGGGPHGMSVRTVADNQKTIIRVVGSKPSSGQDENIVAFLRAEIGDDGHGNVLVGQIQAPTGLGPRRSAGEAVQLDGVGNDCDAAGGDIGISNQGQPVPYRRELQRHQRNAATPDWPPPSACRRASGTSATRRPRADRRSSPPAWPRTSDSPPL